MSICIYLYKREFHVYFIFSDDFSSPHLVGLDGWSDFSTFCYKLDECFHLCERQANVQSVQVLPVCNRTMFTVLFMCQWRTCYVMFQTSCSLLLFSSCLTQPPHSYSKSRLQLIFTSYQFHMEWNVLWVQIPFSILFFKALPRNSLTHKQREVTPDEYTSDTYNQHWQHWYMTLGYVWWCSSKRSVWGKAFHVSSLHTFLYRYQNYAIYYIISFLVFYK